MTLFSTVFRRLYNGLGLNIQLKCNLYPFLLTAKPSEPTEVKLEPQNKTGLLVTWKKPKCSGLYGLKGYLLYYRTTFTPLFKDILVECCSHRIEDVKDGITHYVKLTAIDDRNREGTPSDIHKVYGRFCCLYFLQYDDRNK